MDFARPVMNRMAAASWVMRGHEREDEGRPIAIV
jgi:hypothetical protein